MGAGLISIKNTKIFVWLFDTWLKCTNGGASKTIITDQDKAMKNDITIVISNTQHRYYLCHIMRRLLEKLGSHVEFESALKSGLKTSLRSRGRYLLMPKIWMKMHGFKVYIRSECIGFLYMDKMSTIHRSRV